MSHFLRTQAIYTYILQCHELNELPPTMREIAVACKLPLTTIFRHLDWLESRGYVSRDHTTRSLRPLKPLLTDEEQVYHSLNRALKTSGLALSVNMLCQASELSSTRVKAALHTLVQAERVRSDPDDSRLLYLINDEM
jgi:DNA-binding IclR family transcriptional regulator